MPSWHWKPFHFCISWNDSYAFAVVVITCFRPVHSVIWMRMGTLFLLKSISLVLRYGTCCVVGAQFWRRGRLWWRGPQNLSITLLFTGQFLLVFGGLWLPEAAPLPSALKKAIWKALSFKIAQYLKIASWGASWESLRKAPTPIVKEAKMKERSNLGSILFWQLKF